MTIIILEIAAGIFFFLHSLKDYIAGGDGLQFRIYVLFISILNLLIVLQRHS